MEIGSRKGPRRDGRTDARQFAVWARELDAREAYLAALAAATASLRRAQELYEAASAAIDVHIARSIAADAAAHLSVAASRRAA